MFLLPIKTAVHMYLLVIKRQEWERNLKDAWYNRKKSLFFKKDNVLHVIGPNYEQTTLWLKAETFISCFQKAWDYICFER